MVRVRRLLACLVVAGLLLPVHLVAGDAATGDAATGGVSGVVLVDQEGRDFQLGSLHGQVVLLVFGFTHCPHICPVEMARVSTALRELQPLEGRVGAVFITVDPARDNPGVIKAYLGNFHPAIVGLTGTLEALDAVADHYRVKRVEQATGDGGYLVDHGYSLYILNPRGEAEVAVLPGLPPSHIVGLVQRLLE